VYSRPLLLRGIVLGLLIAVGALAVDMYIPGFAAIARDLHTDPGRVQLSMTAYFLAIACGQILFGPLSDAVGRRRPIFAGLALFGIGSVWAAFAPSIGSLIAARTVQGLGGAATGVIPMAVIRDEHGGPDAARLLSLAMLSLSVSPVLAPTLGGLLVQCASWRVIFAVLAFVTLAAALMVVRLLPETLPPARRVATGPRRLAVTYARLLADRRFLIPILLAGSGQSVLLLFISGSPFVLVTLHGLKPAVYGAVFAAHAMALIGISQFNAVLMQRFGVTRLLGAATAAMAIAAIALAGLVLAGMTALWPFLALTLFMFTCLGLVLAPAFLTALEPFGAIAGAASAIGVALELCLSSAATIALAWTGNGTARPLATLIALSATAAFTAWLAMVMRPAQPRLP
jgi:DHA1 family bicyclomycin/chloramphenicol resistance-like MFS transporter